MSDRMLPADPGDVGPLTRDAITSYRRQRHHRAWEREAAGSGSQGAASSDSLLSRPRGAAGSGAAAVESAADPVVSRSRRAGAWMGWVGCEVSLSVRHTFTFTFTHTHSHHKQASYS